MEFQTTAVLCRELEGLGFRIKMGDDLYQSQSIHNLPPEDEMDMAFKKAKQALTADDPYIDKLKGGKTGLVATLKGDRPGPVYGFRFDIDALPIQESDANDHIPASFGFASQHEGIMHACGHDGHMAIGIGLARQLAAARHRIQGTVHLFFQPAEEVAGGGVIFADLPELQEVDKFLTLHVGIIDKRKIICDTTWIAARIYNVHIQGRASHAGNRNGIQDANPVVRMKAM